MEKLFEHFKSDIQFTDVSLSEEMPAIKIVLQ
jgi:hypothetical protein